MISWLIKAVLVSLVVVAVISMVGCLVAMFGWWSSVSLASLVESFNYGAQTVTTVGYGNWVPADMDLTTSQTHQRIFLVKIISIPFTLVGGGLFAVIVGIIANFVSEDARALRALERNQTR